MNKIIPSILFNFHDEEGLIFVTIKISIYLFIEDLEEHINQGTSMLFNNYPDDNSADDPRCLALQCLRELFGKCNFGSLK